MSNTITQEEALMWWINQLQAEPAHGQELWAAKAGEDFSVVDLYCDSPGEFMYYQLRKSRRPVGVL